MMKYEFEEIAQNQISDEDYVILEKVYMYHPSIVSKQDIAHLYNLPNGMIIIKDMEFRSNQVMELENQVSQKRREMEDLQEELQILRCQI